MFGFYQLLYKITNDENIWYAIGQGIVWYSVRKKWISEFSQKIADVRSKFRRFWRKMEAVEKGEQIIDFFHIKGETSYIRVQYQMSVKI